MASRANQDRTVSFHTAPRGQTIRVATCRNARLHFRSRDANDGIRGPFWPIIKIPTFHRIDDLASVSILHYHAYRIEKSPVIWCRSLPYDRACATLFKSRSFSIRSCESGWRRVFRTGTRPLADRPVGTVPMSTGRDDAGGPAREYLS